MTNPRKLVLYIAMSVDGFIAKPNGDLRFLSVVEKAGEDYGYREFLKTVDTILIGRKTYDKVIEMGFQYPHTGKKVYIITHTKRPDIGSFEYYNGSLKELISKLKNSPGSNIYCDGGAELANALMNDNHIDEMVISVIPVLLGSGIRLFKEGLPENKLKLISSKAFEKGLVQLHYQKLEE